MISAVDELQTPRPRRGVLRNEVLLVLGVSLGASAVYSILAIINKLTLVQKLSQQTTQLNQSVTPERPWLDLAYQLVRIGFLVVPALLAVHLLNRDAVGAPVRLGLDLRHRWFDLGTGVALAALIGIPYSYVAPESYVQTNVMGTQNVAAACRRAVEEDRGRALQTRHEGRAGDHLP